MSRYEHCCSYTLRLTAISYLGKSTGKGGLSLWMHNLKVISFSNSTSDAYSGPAVKMGAGVQAFEAYAAADKVGLNVMGGQCPTVGIVGGYTQGGGHSYVHHKHNLTMHCDTYDLQTSKLKARSRC
jgi:hypothetical protein